MMIMVRNEENNIELVYENVDHVYTGISDMFHVSMKDGSSATFHFIDEEDGSEWDYFQLRR